MYKTLFYNYGGPVIVNGVHLKMEGKHFYGFTLQFMTLQNKGPFEGVAFEIRTVTLLVVQGPEEPKAINIRACLNNAMIAKCEMSMDSLMKDFTMIKDGAAFMARVANTSVYREIHELVETWMSCLAHFLNYSMEAVLARTNKSSVLQVDLEDFRSVK